MSKDFLNFLKSKYDGLEVQEGKVITINIKNLKRTFLKKIMVYGPLSQMEKLLEDLKFYHKGVTNG